MCACVLYCDMAQDRVTDWTRTYPPAAASFLFECLAMLMERNLDRVYAQIAHLYSTF